MKPDGSKSTPNPNEKPAEESSQKSASLDASQTALCEIMVAFVDLGFGQSPSHMALRAANENRPLKVIAQEFIIERGPSK